jgi:hypothetical protein
MDGVIEGKLNIRCMERITINLIKLAIIAGAAIFTI